MIRFFNEDISFNLPHKQEVKKWLTSVVIAESKKAGELSVIFCSDDHLLQINRQYLQHDYYTDIITFDYTEDDVLSGDLFISIDRVRANAEEYGQTFDDELRRVMVHGILHLCGYSDTTDELRKVMQAAEDRYLKANMPIC
jgi:rRNA maturation RNase YbeY